MRFVAIGLVALLAGCGGGDGPAAPVPPPAPTVQAIDDPFTLPAGTPSDLAVLVNDSVTGGAATLAVATPPTHGTVSVQGSTLRYTPDAGFYGSDQFTYRADVGAATSTASVKLTVEAELTLSGSLKPVPTTPTEITAQVGERQFKASADANGAYLVKIKSSRADALVTLTSQSTGAQARLALASAVADFGALSAQPGAQVDETQWPALRLDLLTTGRYGLLLGAGMPTTGTGLHASLRSQDPTDLFNIVMLLRHIVEENGDLPGATTTTLDLLRSKTALARTKYLWESGSKVYLTTTAADFAAAQPPLVGPQGRRLLIGQRFISLTSDGKASVQTYINAPTSYAGRWTQDGDTLRVKLDGPRPAPGTGAWNAEYRLRSIRGTDDRPDTPLMLDMDVDPNCARFAPACVGYTTGWTPVTSFDLDKDRLPLRVEDVASQRWAGLIAETDSAAALCLCRAREVAFGAALELPGFTAQLVDGQLLLHAGPLTHRYTRLRQQADGLELWLVELEQNGQRVKAATLPVVKSGSVVLDKASAMRRWFVTSAQQRDPVHWLGQEQWWQADGKVSWIDHYNGKPYASASWALSSDSREVTMLSSDGFTFRYRPVMALADGYLALFSSSAYSNGTTSLIRLSDLGPLN